MVAVACPTEETAPGEEPGGRQLPEKFDACEARAGRSEPTRIPPWGPTAKAVT